MKEPSSYTAKSINRFLHLIIILLIITCIGFLKQNIAKAADMNHVSESSVTEMVRLAVNAANSGQSASYFDGQSGGSHCSWFAYGYCINTAMAGDGIFIVETRIPETGLNYLLENNYGTLYIQCSDFHKGYSGVEESVLAHYRQHSGCGGANVVIADSSNFDGPKSGDLALMAWQKPAYGHYDHIVIMTSATNSIYASGDELCNNPMQDWVNPYDNEGNLTQFKDGQWHHYGDGIVAYFRFNTDPVSFDDYSIEAATDDNIKACVWLNNPDGKTLTEIGIQCGSDKDTAQEKKITNNVSWTRACLNYNASSFYGPLASNRTYFTRYYAVVDGKKYYSDWIEAKTTGDVSFDTYSTGNLWESDVLLSAWLDNPNGHNLSEIGILCGKSRDSLTGRTIATNVTWTRSLQEHYLSSTLGYLESDTAYCARYYAMANSKYYYSDWFDITTPAGGLSFDTYALSDVSDRDAKISVWTSNPNAWQLSDLRIMLGKTKESAESIKITGNVDWTRFSLDYNLSSFFGYLEPNTTYYARYHIIHDNKNYYSDWQTFMTSAGRELTIALDPNGGSVAQESIAVIYGNTYGNLPACVRDGYVFDGWFTDPAGGEQIANGNIVRNPTILKLYAHWVEPNYITDGICGEHLTWVLARNGTLIISGNGEMYDFDGEELAPWYDYRDEVVSVVVENGVTSIGESAFFYDYGELITVIMADSVTRIGENAFQHCTALTGIRLSDNLAEIGSLAFAQCPALTSVTLPDGLETLGMGVFISSGLKSITVPSGTETKTWDFFYPGNSGGFYLYHITLPASVEDAGYGTFCDTQLPCDNPDFIMPSGLKTIEEKAFFETDPHFVWLKDDVENIGVSAFEGCANLRYVFIPDSCKTIAPNVFPEGTKILGISGHGNPGTAESYANTYGYEFINLEAPFGGDG